MVRHSKMTKLKLIIPKPIQGTQTGISNIEKSNSDDAALLPLETELNEKERSVTPSVAPPVVRKVRFAPTESILYHNDPFTLDYESLFVRWYTKTEVDTFFQDMGSTMMSIQTSTKESPNPFYWTKALVQIYKAFSAPLASQKSLLILMNDRLEIDDESVGLEVRAIPVLNEASKNRRQELLSRIRYWQEHGPKKLTTEQLAELIYEASSQSSVASTSYAKYIAEYHARGIHQEK